MKKYMMLAGMVMVSTIIFAQRHNGDHVGRSTKRAEKMKTELSLTDEQFNKVKAINEKFASNHIKLRNDTAVTVGTARKRAIKLKADHDAEIKSVLTAEQWTKWSSLRSKRGEEHRKHGRGKGHRG